MTKVTEKNTKAQILDAYEAALNTIKELKAGKTTTADVVKAKEIKAVKEAAKEIVELNILNDDMMQKYNSLIATIEMLEAEVEELYSIKREADSLEALANSHKELTTQLEKEYADKKVELDKKYEDRRATYNADLDSMYERNAKTLKDLEEKSKEEKAKIEKERKREIEEYNYKLKRDRAIENDQWTDEKAAREKELADKEAIVAKRELEITLTEEVEANYKEKIEQLEAMIPKEREDAFEAGKAKAKKDAETSKVFSDRAHKAELDRKDDVINSLERSNGELRQSNDMLQSKLDAAYTRIQEMAIESAKNSGVRMVDSTNK